MKKIIVLLALVLFLFFPVFISAQNVPSQDQMTQQLIALLEQTIARLQQQIIAILSQRSSTATVPAATPAPNASSASTGSLTLAENTSYLNQSIIAPQTNFKLADFSLTNNTTVAINLNKIEADLAVNSDSSIVNLYISNSYVTYGSNKTSVLGTTIGNNYWTISSQLQPGQTIELAVYGNINSTIPTNSTISSGLLVSGVSAVSATNVYTNSNLALPGQSIILGTGSLTASQDGSTPAARIVVAGQKVVAGKFQFTANSDSYVISELKFVVPSSNAGSMIRQYPPVYDAVLSDGATQALLSTKPAQVVYDGSEYILDFNVNIPVSLNSSKYVTVSYDLNANIDSYSTNLNVAPILAYVKATNSENTLIDGAAGNYKNIIASYNGITLPAAGGMVNGLYVFKSIPTFTGVSSSNSSITNGLATSLYTFSIGANPSGNISVKQLTFLITVTDPNVGVPNLTNFTLLKGNKDYTGSVAIGSVINNNYYLSLVGKGGIGVGPANTVVVTFNQEEIIPAGTTQTYTLKAVANNFVAADSISTSAQSDALALSGGSKLGTVFSKLYYGLTQSYTDPIVVNYYNILWSDMSETMPNPHNSLNGSYTNDWYNGFGVLSVSSQ